MNPRPLRRGMAVVYILVVISLICGLIFASLLRAQVGLKAVKDRHLSHLARDLAESGVELQRWMIGQGRPSPETAPLQEDLGPMAGHQARFTSFARPQDDGSLIIVSTGTLEPTKGQRGRSLRLTVTLRPGPDGKWQIVSGEEQYLE